MQSLIFACLVSQLDRVTGTYGQAAEITADFQKGCFIFSRINAGGDAPIEVPFTNKESLEDQVNWMFSVTPQRSGMLNHAERKKLVTSLVSLAELYVDHPVYIV